jgi:hypothetical protein
MVSEAGNNRASGRCQVCMDTNKIDDLRDLIRAVWIESNDFVCRNGHVRCAYCSYLSSDGPSYFRDYTGRTYLSNKFNTSPAECSNGHSMAVEPEPAEFTCNSCARRYKGNPEEVINVCRECKEYICVECEETDVETLKAKYYRSLIKQIEVVTHFVEDRLEEAYPCGCGKYFLKVYQSRRIDSKLHIGASIKEFVDEGAVRWNCYVCGKVESKLRVHLACFYCLYAQALSGKPGHIEICIQCAVNSGLIGRSIEPKAYEKETEFKCEKGHLIIKTSTRDQGELFYSCSYCRKTYYPFTERYECRSCRTKICKECSPQHLVDDRSFPTDLVLYP